MGKLWAGLWLLLLMPLGTDCAMAQEKGNATIIDVTGQASVTAAPNQASVTFSIENMDAKAETAIRKNAELTGRVVSAVKRISGKEAVISTAGYMVQPQYEREKDYLDKPGRVVPRAYRVANSILVRTSRVERLGAVVDAAVAAGAARVGNLSFSRDDRDQLQKQAAVKALENASDYARRLAKAAGLGIKRIKYIQYVPAGIEGGGGDQIQAEEARTTPLMPGQVTVESCVSVTFELFP